MFQLLGNFKTSSIPDLISLSGKERGALVTDWLQENYIHSNLMNLVFFFFCSVTFKKKLALTFYKRDICRNKIKFNDINKVGVSSFVQLFVRNITLSKN